MSGLRIEPLNQKAISLPLSHYCFIYKYIVRNILQKHIHSSCIMQDDIIISNFTHQNTSNKLLNVSQRSEISAINKNDNRTFTESVHFLELSHWCVMLCDVTYARARKKMRPRRRRHPDLITNHIGHIHFLTILLVLSVRYCTDFNL